MHPSRKAHRAPYEKALSGVARTAPPHLPQRSNIPQEIFMQAFQSRAARLATSALPLAVPAFAQNIGPSTSTSPYVLPTRPGVTTTSILTVGDAVSGYKMVGIP